MRHAAALDGGPGPGGLAVEALEQDALVARHAAQVVPALRVAVADGRRLARVAGRVAVLDGHDVGVGEGGGRGEGERERLDGLAVQRPPHVHDAVAALQQGVGFVGEVALDALDYRLRCLWKQTLVLVTVYWRN